MLKPGTRCSVHNQAGPQQRRHPLYRGCRSRHAAVIAKASNSDDEPSHSGGIGESVAQRAARLRAEQARLEAELAELEELAQGLDADERAELQAALQGVDAATKPANTNAKQESVDMPAAVRAFLEAAGTAEAVPWDGRPVVGPDDDSFLRPRLPVRSWDVTSTEPGEGVGTFDPAALSEAEWQELLAGGDLGGGAPGSGHSGEWAPDGEGWDGADAAAAAGGTSGTSGGSGRRKGEEGGRKGRRRMLGKPPLLREDGLDQGHDDEFMPGDDEAVAEDARVAGALATLEEGGQLPPDERERGRPREPAAKFLARMDALRAIYEAQYRKGGMRTVSPEALAALDEGWDSDAEEPVENQDILEVRASPDVPLEIDRQFRRMEWMLYRLRRAHAQAGPAGPAAALASAGLAAEDVVYEDGVVECTGVARWFDYACRVASTGATTELYNIWANMSEHRPSPRWYIAADMFLNVPWPDWYDEYLQANAQPDDEGAPSAGVGAGAASVLRDTEAYFGQGAGAKQVPQPPALPQRPREGSGNPFGPQWEDAFAERALSRQTQVVTGTAPFLPSEWPADPAGAATADPDAGSGGADDPVRFFSAPGTRASAARRGPRLRRLERWVSNSARPLPPLAAAAASSAVPGRAELLPTLRRMQALAGMHAEPRAQSLAAAADPRADPVSRALRTTGEDLLAGCRGKQEAEVARDIQALASSMAAAAGRPEEEEEEEEEEEPPLGRAWQTGRCFTIPMTVMYCISTDLGQVERVQVHWNGIIGATLGGHQDALDAYVAAARLTEIMACPGFRLRLGPAQAMGEHSAEDVYGD
ncbi:hypothetical protein WJX81_000305 [Elliptochloris bilobata]|uniref:Uncharacterized protein n=1 Tax=Elliptochloris bilobata TaxID=381761 RepID=A0AAW1RID4_9CHLO